MKSDAPSKQSSTRKAKAPTNKKSTGARKPIGSRRPDRAAKAKAASIDWQSIAEQRAAEVAIINSVQQGLASKLDMQGIIDLVGDKIREIFNADVVAIALKDGATNLIRLPYVLDHGERFFPDPMPLRGFTGHVLQTRLPLVIHTIEENNRLGVELGSINIGGETIDHSFIYAPIMSGETATGVMTIGKKEAHAFSDSDLNLITTLATSLSVALENARLFDETQRLLKETEQRAAELAIINSVGQGLARELDFQAIVDLVGDKIRRIFDAQALSIRLVDRATNLVHFPYAFEQGKRVQIDPVPLGIGFTDHVLRTWQPLVINHDVEQRMAEFGSYVLPGTLSTQSIVVVPILAGDQAIGVISLEHEREQAFSDSAVNLLTTLAANLGVALQNARLFDETRRLLKETDQRAAELALINSVQEGLASKLDFLSIVDLVGDKVREIFGSQDISIGLYDRAANLLSMPYYMGASLELRVHTASGSAAYGAMSCGEMSGSACGVTAPRVRSGRKELSSCTD